jgi:YidC/Oxa1 family membrane protein insertase
MDTLEHTDSSARLRRAMFLSIMVYMVWVMFFAPQQQIQQVATIDGNEATQNDSIVETTPEPVVENTPPINPVQNTIPDHFESFSDDQVRATISSKNGSINSAELLDFPELPVNNPWWSWIIGGEGEWDPYIKGADAYPISTVNGSLILAGSGRPVVNENYSITRTKSEVVAISASGGMTIQKNYKKTDKPYIYNVDIQFINNSGKPQDIWVGVGDELKEDSGRFYDELRPQYYADGIETYTDLASIDEKPDGTEESPYWFGLGSRYFFVAASEFNENKKEGDSVFSRVEVRSFGEDQYGSIAYFKEPLAAGAKESLSLTLYIGPKELDRLSTMSDTWGQAVDFGFFGFFSRVLLFILKIIYAGVANWGAAIILLTVVVKVIFYPMTQKAFESGRKMQMLQPQLNEVKEKYKDDKMLQSQETMKIFKENNVSPAGGCLPTLIQMPVWFALYNALLYSVELYNSSFLYLQDLTSPDPYGILPVLYGILMFASQTLMKPGKQGEVSEQQAMMMKMMKFMTVMFTFFMFTFPSGLVIYFCCNMLLSTLQQVLIKKRLEGTLLVPVSEKG